MAYRLRCTIAWSCINPVQNEVVVEIPEEVVVPGRPGRLRCAALCVGIGSFADNLSQWSDLPFASDKSAGGRPSRAELVASGLRRFGIAPTVLHDITRERLRVEAEKLWSGRDQGVDLAVVHLVGHGHVDTARRLRFIDRDGRGLDVDALMADAQESWFGPRVLFLLDMCGAGLAAGAVWSTELNAADRQVWAVGACTADASTAQGRFSQAVANALHVLADFDYPTVNEPVRFDQFCRELINQAKQEESSRRLSMNFYLQLDDGDWPMLPNPLTVVDSMLPGSWAARALDYLPGLDIGALIAALDRGGDIDDLAHFADKASGRGLSITDLRWGMFTGRAEELAHIRRWLDGDNELLVIRGGPGAGKSALLGVWVCAGHEQLREVLRRLWRDVPGVPAAPIPGLIAAHARQRSAGEVMDTIAAQAELGDGPLRGTLGASRNGWTRLTLRSALATTRIKHVIVIDAVDESTEIGAMTELIESLTRKDADGDPPAARLLVGGRPEVADMLTAITGAANPLDLDAVNRGQLRIDIRAYLARLLGSGPPYDSAGQAKIRELIAEVAADRMVPTAQTPGTAWGPFLVAGMFAHYVSSLPHPVRDIQTARAVAQQASPELPEVLELVLDVHGTKRPLLRPVLAALARALGDGMPRSVLRRAATAFLPEHLAVSRELTEEAVRDTLSLAHPYLRIGIDEASGEKLYRLFHQGLADYLRARPYPAVAAIEESRWRQLELLMLTRMLRLPDPPPEPAEPEPAEPEPTEPEPAEPEPAAEMEENSDGG
jgi:hypothetical protein